MNSLSHTVEYKNHSVGYVFHSVKYKTKPWDREFVEMFRRILEGVSKNG